MDNQERRRSEDHPWDAPARVVLGVVFGLAAVYFGQMEAHVPMALFLIACGAMMRVRDVGAGVARILGK